MNLLNSLTNFHFLRPELLALLLLLPVLVLLLRKGVTRDNSWSQHINPILLTAMQGGHNTVTKKRARTWLLTSSLALLVIAAAGPSWVEKPQPTTQRSDNMVVVLDLSLSMLAEDTPPSRLVRAKQKIVDLLGSRNEGSTALIAFSGDSFVVTPLTDDMPTIESNLSALEPLIMPVIGSRPDIAIEQAKDLLVKAGSSQGRIVLVTDGVASHQIDRITDALDGVNIELNLIAVGTEEGGPIRLPDNRGYLKESGSVVIAKTELASLSALASANGGVFSELALDNSDLDAIDASGTQLLLDEQANQVQGQFDQWEDMGYIFLALALPLCLLAYRQGGLLVLVIFISPQQSEAFELNDAWLTPDQQAQQQAQEGNYEAAAQLYESQRHKADALYRSGAYEQAAKLYEQFDDADSLYNLGNALARAGKLPEAIAAYEKSLNIGPENQQTQENKALVESLLKQQEQSESQSGEQSEDQDSTQNNQNSEQQSGGQSEQRDSDSQDSDSSSDQTNSQQLQDSQSPGQQEQGESSEEMNEDQQSQPSPESAEDIEQMNQQQSQSSSEESASDSDKDQQEDASAITQEQLKALEEQAQNEQPSDQSMAIEESLSPEEQRSYEQWMRRVPDDPSGLLRRKFEQQARERRRENNPEEPLW
jgi:von Willebrand factor type A domain/Tetratricopeptide repeat